MEEILEIFPHIIENGCLIELSQKHTFIFDDKKGRFVEATEKYHLHIENQTNEDVIFIQNDDCVMKDIKGGQCDYVIFNDSYIFFCEIKATNENLSNNRKKALEQLKNTILFYYKKGLFETKEHKIALITFEKRKRIAPQASASSSRKEFRDIYNVDLQEGNYILFE